LHSLSPAGFVYLEFSFCFLQYIALPACCNCSPFLFRVCMGKCPSPLSRGACYTLASVRCLPLSKHTVGGGTTPAFSGWLVYLQFVQESAPSPLQWSFSHDSHCYKLSLLQGCWVGATTPAFSGQLVYLQFCEGVPLPHSPELRAPHPLCYLSFFFSCLFIIVCFFFFPWAGVSLSRGLC
jgi:hypothetical protein